MIARIFYGGIIDRQGLLHVGDIIKEVNGQEVGNNPTELQDMLKDCSGGITLKIQPSYVDSAVPPQVLTPGHSDSGVSGFFVVLPLISNPICVGLPETTF